MADQAIPSVSDLFNVNKKLEKITIRSGAVMGRGKPRPDLYADATPKNYESSRGFDYIQPYVEEEEKLLLMGHRSDLSNISNTVGLPGSDSKEVCQMEDLTSIGSVPNLGDVEGEESLQVYDHYDFKPKESKLPIAKKRTAIIRMVDTNQVLLILGSTGCGKSTQVPQYILDHHAKMRKKCNIIVTQPRRIAATSVAKRVCFERGWELSTIVGYQIGLDNKTSPDTRLTYCTTGVLREKLVRDRSMMEYTHVILDEVHERDLEMDFLMLIVRKLLRTNSRTVKVILMSATIDPTRFAKYFSLPLGKSLCPAPVLDVEKETPYEVKVHHIDDLQELKVPIPTFEVDEPQISEEALEIAVRLIMHFDKMDEMAFFNVNSRRPTDEDNFKPAVLVFLPGIHEIEDMHGRLESKSKENPKFRWHKIPLHSSITKDEQSRVFQEAAPGYRKVILSTNIAESSITVQDVVYVVDFCLTKHLVCDPNTNFSSLRYAWAAKSNCKQRAGRAGRVRNGRVYRMVPLNFYERMLPTECDPEMMRCPLSQTVLKAKMLKMGDPKAILALALDPPEEYRVGSTIRLLKEAGALLLTSEGKFSDFDGDLTFLGTIMSNLPLDIQLSKLIMLGYIFSILEEAIVIAAWMSVRNVFRNDFHDRLAPYAAKIGFDSSSDCIAYLNLHKIFTEKLRTNYFKTSRDNEAGFCSRNYLNLKAMREANELVDELRKRLKNIGVYEHVVEDRPKWNDYEIHLVRKVVIAGAFYPNYFTKKELDEREALRDIAGKDPFSTIYLKGLPLDQPGEIYSKVIKDCMEKNAGQVSNVSFDGSSKVYVEFERNQKSSRNTNVSGKILYPVYRAVKMRQLKIPIRISLLSTTEAVKRLKKLEAEGSRFLSLGKRTSESVSRYSNLADLCKIHVTWVNDPNSFWIVEEGYLKELNCINKLLSTSGNTLKCSQRPSSAIIYAAPFPPNSNELYRANLLKDNGDGTVEVIYIDYGNIEKKLPIDQIREIGSDIAHLKSFVATPPYATECTLTGICPSLFLNKNETWTLEAVRRFNALVSNECLKGTVFSVVDGVVSITISDSKGREINKLLVEEGFATLCEESYRSKLQHEFREKASSYVNSSESFNASEVTHNFIKRKMYPEPPSRQECVTNVQLRGPSSPLEMRICARQRVAEGRDIGIDLESVNSVLLDSHPEDTNERLLVAGFVGTNSAGTRMKLAQTTLMPNIPGLFAMICLIFSPSVELRRNPDKSKYIGALCGLGYNKKLGKSYSPENEMEVQFDVRIGLKDLKLVNQLRFWMNKPLATQEGQEMWDITPVEFIECQKRVKEYFLKLFVKQRVPQEKELFPRAYHWLQYDDEELLYPGFTDERSVYPPHYALVISDEEDEN